MSKSYEIDERLPEVAPRAFALAQQHCPDCGFYHGLWPYLRLTGVTRGVERDRQGLLEQLRALLPEAHDILIAGSADSGLTALMLEAMAGAPKNLTVVDRCPTPLILCRELADRLGVALRTQAVLLQDLPWPDSFDLIFGHSVFGHIPPADQAAAMRRLFEVLRPGGRVMLVFRERLPSDAALTADERSVEGWHDIIKQRFQVVVDAGVPLPEDRATYDEALRVYTAKRATRHEGALSRDAYVALVESAGFTVEALAPLPLGPAWLAGGTATQGVRPSHALIARRPTPP